MTRPMTRTHRIRVPHISPPSRVFSILDTPSPGFPRKAATVPGRRVPHSSQPRRVEAGTHNLPISGSPLIVLTILLFILTGCSLPGRPGPNPEVPRPESVLDASTLYRQNCSGCHGADGQQGPATNLANPVYQSFIDEPTLRSLITNGEPGSLMPAFSKAAGGPLVDTQIDALVKGIRARWYKGDVLAGSNPPPYKASTPGDPNRGHQVYASSCARCHGPDAQHPGPKGSILDGSFLALVTPQTIRTTILAGRPDLRMPDFRTLLPDHPMTNAEVTDVTAWLLSQRPPAPGQPYPDQQPDSQPPGEAQPNNIQAPTPTPSNPKEPR